jgi:pyridoxal phosphate enzyme (YggS family)
MLEAGAFRASLRAVREHIEEACRRSGRSAEQVRIMAVTKTFGYDYAQIAMQAGVDLFGENRVQEAAQKWTTVPEGVELHLVGHLQRNKAKAAAALFSAVDSIDRIDTALALEQRLSALGRSMDVLVEVNTSGEASKFGITDVRRLGPLLDGLLRLEHLRVRGLMTVGPYSRETDRVRRAFAELRRLFEDSRAMQDGAAFDTLSMGMSGDYVIAVEEGATQLRLGTALFGTREARGG